MTNYEIVEMALKNGLVDNSYPTLRHGRVESYRGQATIEANGKKYLVVGYGPTGSAECVKKQGGYAISEI